MEINIGNGVSVRAAYKAMRKRVRIEARRQKELEKGHSPEVPLQSFLELLKHKLRRVPEPPKRVLTPAAMAAEHRRAKDKRQRETLCWWMANGKECFNGDRCAFKRVVPQECRDKLRAGLACHCPVRPQNSMEAGRKCQYLVQLQVR